MTTDGTGHDLFAALNLATGQPVYQTRPQHRAIEFRRFLDAIDDAVPEHLEVHVVLDNPSTHKTPVIHKWLLRHPRFTFHFTPTSSSWFNLVERWFAELTRRLRQRSAHPTVAALTADLDKTGSPPGATTQGRSAGTRPTIRSSTASRNT
jgi:DDE superfamily endonuclease